MNFYRTLKGMDEAVKDYPAMKTRLKSLTTINDRLKALQKKCSNLDGEIKRLASLLPTGSDDPFDHYMLRDMFQHVPMARVLKAIQERTKTQYLGDHRAVAHLAGRDFVFLDTRDTNIAPHLMFYGYWEVWTMSFLSRVITPGCVFADVGANFGYFSIFAGALTEKEITLIPIEANPRLVDLMRRSLPINGYYEAEVIDRAVWHRSGETVVFGEPEGDTKNGAVLQFRPEGERSSKFDVQTISLDDALCGKGVDVLKIDVEGAEVEAWDGMQKLLDERPSMISLIEVNYLRCRDCTRIIAEARQRGLNVGYLSIGTYDSEIRPLEDAAFPGPNPREDWLLVLTQRPLESLNSPL